jgi:uncharacterized protein (TIGR02266 family)
MSQDQRKAARVPLEVEISMQSEHNFFTGIANNISEGGIFIATLAPPPVGTEIGFELVLGAERFLVMGVVCWVRDEHAAKPGVPAGCGMKWGHIEDGMLEAIKRFVEVRDADLYDDD